MIYFPEEFYIKHKIDPFFIGLLPLVNFLIMIMLKVYILFKRLLADRQNLISHKLLEFYWTRKKKEFFKHHKLSAS